MKNVIITIPDNCELIKDGNTYIVKDKEEKKQAPPRSWEEFCERCSVKDGESYIMPIVDKVFTADANYDGKRLGRTWCVSKKEAEAFLALMQLRQLRKAWIGDWEQTSDSSIGYILYDIKANRLTTGFGKICCFITLSFPSCEMAEDFLSCFRDLCETAKILL